MGFSAKCLYIFVALILTVCLFRAQFMFHPKSTLESCLDSKHNHKYISLKENPMILERFKKALNIATISYKPHIYEANKMLEFIDHIESSYPNLHKSPFVRREIISKYSLLYSIAGSEASLSPYMLTCHIDVVPAINEKWSSNPFNATIRDDGYIYARGTIDAKHLTIAIFEAIEHLFEQGFQPKRSLFLAFGHDEEVLGYEGAQEIARLIKARIKGKHEKLLFVIDEGNIISQSRFPGVPYDVAFIGVAEKGYLSVNLSVSGEVGHGSMPQEYTAISKLARVLGKFDNYCMATRVGLGFERELFEILASYASWPEKLIYANFWLAKPFIGPVFAQHPALNGIIRTTSAITMIEGGTKENMLPDSASAILNQRIHESQTVDEIMELNKKLINDPTVDMSIASAYEPTPIAPYCSNCLGYQLIKNSLMHVYPNTIAVPSAFLATTDSKWFGDLTDGLYRFSAIAVKLEEMRSFHGHDERISVVNYERLINFYYRLIINSDHQIYNDNIVADRDEL